MWQSSSLGELKPVSAIIPRKSVASLDGGKSNLRRSEDNIRYKKNYLKAETITPKFSA